MPDHTTDPNTPDLFPATQPLLRLSESDRFTVRDSFEGTLILGKSGGGKTSSSGMNMANAMMRSGYGGIVLTHKPGEVEYWRKLARDTGRSECLMLFGPDHPDSLDILNYGTNRPGPGAGIAANIVHDLAVASEGEDAGRYASEVFWSMARDAYFRNMIALVTLATGTVTWDDFARLVSSLPKRPEQVLDPTWQQTSACADMIRTAFERCQQDERKLRELENVMNYVLDEFPNMDPRPRSSILAMANTMIDMLRSGPVRELFLTKSTFVPDFICQGLIIVMDMPVQQYNETGRFCQRLFKTIVQQMLERRPDRDENARPVFIWADEAQNFVTSNDQRFQTVARDSRTATVYLTQNLPNLYNAFGRDGRDAAHSLVACLNTKVFHANGCPDTNRFAEQLFGQELVLRDSTTEGHSATSSPQGGSRSWSFSRTWNKVIDQTIRAKQLTELLPGGYARGFSEAMLFRAGGVWSASQSNALLCRFPQTVLDSEMYK